RSPAPSEPRALQSREVARVRRRRSRQGPAEGAAARGGAARAEEGRREAGRSLLSSRRSRSSARGNSPSVFEPDQRRTAEAREEQRRRPRGEEGREKPRLTGGHRKPVDYQEQEPGGKAPAETAREIAVATHPRGGRRRDEQHHERGER